MTYGHMRQRETIPLHMNITLRQCHDRGGLDGVVCGKNIGFYLRTCITKKGHSALVSWRATNDWMMASF